MASLPTKKGLYAKSGNQCPFPGCNRPLYNEEYGSVVSQISHIRAQSEGGPRYDPDYPVDYIHGEDNLAVFCNEHHKIVDDNPDKFSVQDLLDMKERHEAKVKHLLDVDDAIVELLAKEWNISIDMSGSVNRDVFNVTSVNQQGGITAANVTVGKKPRIISPQRSAQLAQFLQSQPPLDVYLGIKNGDSEAARLGNQIGRVLALNRWNIESASMISSSSLEQVEIKTEGPKSDVPQQLIALAQTLLGEGIPVLISFNSKVTKPRIIIGENL